MDKEIWAEPRDVASIDDCYFYHTMEIPNHGVVHGQWDLRGKAAAYLGNVDLSGKRVLEMGTASGFFTFAMEAMGAQVTTYDLSDQDEWDIVPYAGFDYDAHVANRKDVIRRLNNGFWFAHRAHKSSARALYGSIYEIPDEIGEFDVCTFGAILLHLRDPFLALQRVTAHVKEAVIVTEELPKVKGLKGRALAVAEALLGGRVIHFLPRAKKNSPFETWWRLSPKLVEEFLQILGFRDTEVQFHRQTYKDREVDLYTVVGRR